MTTLAWATYTLGIVLAVLNAGDLVRRWRGW